MQRAAACLGIIALAAALGAMVIGQLVVVPGLQGQSELVDLNLLTRLTAPIHLRCVEIAMLASVVLAGIAPYWLRSRTGSTLALLSVACTGTLRLVVVPQVYEAWAHVDRVTSLPLARWMRAEGLVEEAHWLGLGSITILGLMSLLVGFHWLVPVPRRPRFRDEPTLGDEPMMTEEQPMTPAVA